MNTEETQGPAMVLFPMAGCEPYGSLTKEQLEVRKATLRETVRKHWNEPAVQAIVALLEQRAVRIQQQALAPGATPHDAGQGYEAGECVKSLRMIFDTVEKRKG